MRTPSQTIGPFFGYALPDARLTRLVPDGTPGAVSLTGAVYDGAGDAVPDALLEIWQADPEGRFGGSSFGRCATDTAGRYAFRTVRPGTVRTVDGVPQAPHIDLVVFARGLLTKLVSRVYLPGEPANDADPVLRALPERERATLIAEADGDLLRHDLHLSGERETVFFAL